MVSLLLIAAASLSDPALAAKAPTGPVVLRDVEAGRHSIKQVPEGIDPDTTMEPSIAANPSNSLNVVVVYMEGRGLAGGAQGVGYATTFNGGKKWSTGTLPGATEATGGSFPLITDPVVAFGPNDIVYASFILLSGDTTREIGVNVSRDGGKTWGETLMVPTERTFPLDDKSWIAVDTSDAPGHHPGRIYMVWDQVAPVVALYSDDQAETWHGPFVIFPGVGVSALPLVMPSGDLAVVFRAFYPVEDARVQMIAIAPGAGTIPTAGPLAFSPAIPIAQDQGGAEIRGQRASGNFPTAAVDPETGRIYVAWSDTRFRSDGVNDVVLSGSDDGVVWSEPVKVNSGDPDDYLDHFHPSLAVASDGTVALSYRTQQEAASAAEFSPHVDSWYQQSTDGGETWSAPLKVNRRVRTDVRYAALAQGKAFLGDYSQIAVAGSWTYIARCEAFGLTAAQRRKSPYSEAPHHARVWVAIVDADGDGKR